MIQKKHLIIMVIAGMLLLSGRFTMDLHGQRPFDPAKDGWSFGNTGRTLDSWDLFRRAYIGVSTNKDCVSVPLDCAFYKLFNVSGEQGVCGGMSYLALAMLKYGGYMGFCYPPDIFTGGKSGPPDRKDLYDALSIIQSRQFSARGVRHFLDIVDAGKLNDPVSAFKDVQEAMAKNDYPVLSIAKDMVGNGAHIVIPYKTEENKSLKTKTIYIWDCNYPYKHNKSDYSATSSKNKMVIYFDGTYKYRNFPKSSIKWCFCIPMSKVLAKARHPLALDFVMTALTTAFVKGTGASITQITDQEGRRLYKQGQPGVLETDPAKRLPGAAPWPWYGQRGRNEKKPADLVFLRRAPGEEAPLHVQVEGQSYEAVFSVGGNLIEMECSAAGRGRDIITLDAIGYADQSISIETDTQQRTMAVSQLRTAGNQGEWRRFDVSRLTVTSQAPAIIEALGNLDSVAVSSGNRAVAFDLEIQQRVRGVVTMQRVEKLQTGPTQRLKITPKDWRILDRSQIKKELVERDKEKR